MSDFQHDLNNLLNSYSDFQTNWPIVKAEMSQNPKLRYISLTSQLREVCNSIQSITDYQTQQPKLELIIVEIIHETTPIINKEQARPSQARPQVGAQAQKEKKDKKHGKAA